MLYAIIITIICIALFEVNIVNAQSEASTNETVPPPPVLTCALSLSFEDEKTLQKGCELCTIPPTDCNCIQQPFICMLVKTLGGTIDENTTVIDNTNIKVNETITKKGSKFEPIFKTTIGVLAIIGNGLVLLVCYSSYHQLSRCNKLIALLAFLDTIFALILLIVSIPQLWTNKWVYANFFCTVGPNTQDFLVAMATGVIMIIAIERYVGIIYPCSQWLTKRRFYLLLLINLIIAIAMVIPVFLYTRVIEGYCIETFTKTQSEVYTWSVFVIYFVLPCLITMVLYIRIIYHLDSLSKTSLYMIGSEKQKAKRLQDNKRIMKIVVSILVAFVLLTLPNRIYWIIKEYDDIILGEYSEERANTEKILKFIGFVPYTLHIIVNPIIYSVVDLKFRRKIMKIFSCCFCGCDLISVKDKFSINEPTFMTNDEEIELKSVNGTVKKNSQFGYVKTM